jgi:hypothetical protein
MVTSKPKRISVAVGLVHIIFLLIKVKISVNQIIGDIDVLIKVQLEIYFK